MMLGAILLLVICLICAPTALAAWADQKARRCEGCGNVCPSNGHLYSWYCSKSRGPRHLCVGGRQVSPAEASSAKRGQEERGPKR
jgi:hypothetical protein